LPVTPEEVHPKKITIKHIPSQNLNIEIDEKKVEWGLDEENVI
jgi:hypothetical protein